MIVGILGLGAIGSLLARELSKDEAVEGILGCDIDPKRIMALKDIPKLAASSVDGLLRRSTVIVEAASVAAARTFLPRAMDAGKDVVVLSVGALADPAFRKELRAAAKKSGGRLHVPSRALGGSDAPKAARPRGAPEGEIE